MTHLLIAAFLLFMIVSTISAVLSPRKFERMCRSVVRSIVKNGRDFNRKF